MLLRTKTSAYNMYFDVFFHLDLGQKALGFR